MKTTATLMDIIQAELHMDGLDEFANVIDGSTQLTMNDDRFAFIAKVARYDDDIKRVVDRRLFAGYTIPNDVANDGFKHAFVNKFMDREISRQTVNAFTAQLVSYTIQNEQMIIELYANLEKYFHNAKNDKTTNSNKHGDNTAEQTLAQNNVTFDLTTDDVTYADNARYNRGYVTAEGTNDSESYDPDTLAKLMNIQDKLLDKFDRHLFLQIW